MSPQLSRKTQQNYRLTLPGKLNFDFCKKKKFTFKKKQSIYAKKIKKINEKF